MTALDAFLAATSPQPAPSTFAARDPVQSAGKPATMQAAASPPPLQYITFGAGSYRCVTATFPAPTLKLPKARPVVTTIVSVPAGVAIADVVAAALRQPDVSILTAGGSTVVAYRARLERCVNLSKEPGFPPSPDGTTMMFLAFSTAPTDYR